MFLDTERLPCYLYSALKRFHNGEKHVSRIINEDILIIMIEGTLYFDEDSVPIVLTAGEYYIQRKKLFQQGQIPSSDAVYYYIHFDGSYCEEGGIPLRGKVDFSKLMSSFAKLDFFMVSSKNAIEKNAIFYSILSYLCESNTATPENSVVEKVLSLISQDLKEQYSLASLSKICGYSKNHIINVFKKQTGRTPFAYIQNVRIDTAKVMLKTSDLPVSVIAEETGFGNYVNFYKEFTKKNGMSPLEWRKKYK